MLTSNSRPSDLHANFFFFFIRFSQNPSPIICVIIEPVMENENKIASDEVHYLSTAEKVSKNCTSGSAYVRLKFIIDQVSDSFFFFFTNSDGKRFEERGVNEKINGGMCVDL